MGGGIGQLGERKMRAFILDGSRLRLMVAHCCVYGLENSVAAADVAQLVEHLPRMSKALASIPSTT